MTTGRIKVVSSLSLGVVAAIAIGAWGQQSNDILVIDQPVNHDLYAAQREVNVRSTVNGDLVAAGQRITIDGVVTGDIIVAAQNIDIQSDVGDDLRAAGQHIRVTSPVSGHIVAAGQTVTIEQSVGDWAWLAGDTVEVLGSVGSNLKVRAKKITIDAEVTGDVDLIGEQLDLGSKTVIRGDLKWRSSNKARISPDAQIDGEFIEEPLPEFAEELSTGSGYSLPLSVIVAVMVLFLLFSRLLHASADQIATRPGRSLLLGLVVFLSLPSLTLLLFFTGIGVWLGLAVLLIFFVLLLLGVFTGLFAASDMALRMFRPQPAMWQSLVAIFVTVVAVGLLAKVPWIGSICVMAILWLGMGALCWSAWATQRKQSEKVSVHDALQ